MLTRLFTQKNSLKSATSILVVTLTLSNLLGMLRDHFLAQKVPTTYLDTYYAAFRIPDLLFNTLILGAVSSAFIPVFSRYISNNEQEEANEVASSVFSLGLLGIIISVIGLYIFMPHIVPLLVPDFDFQKQQLTLSLSRVLLLSPLFFSVSYFLSSILNSYKRFFVSALAPLVYNLSIIFSTLFLSDTHGVMAVGWGVVVGAFLHMLIQIFPVRHLGLRIRLRFGAISPSVKEIGRLMIPRSIGLGSLQILLFVFTALASGIGPGAVAIFSLADNIQTLPTVVFGNSVASALFPTLAESFSLGKIKDFSRYLEKAIISILFFMVPASIGIILLRIQIVRLVLGSGHFGWEQTIMAAQTLGFFAISLQFSGLIPLLARSFYAIKNTRTPTIYGIIGVVTSITAGILLSPKLGVAGLSLAFSIGSIVNCILLFYSLRKALPELSEERISQSLNQIIIGTIAMALSIQLIKISIGTIFDLDRFIEVAIQTAVSAGVGAAVYFAITHILGFREINLLGLDKILGLFSGVNNGNKKD